jgi:hypothetical protein
VYPESSESSLKRCIEKLNRNLEDQINLMKEKIWSQFRDFWYESGAKEEIIDFLLAQDQYKQDELESHIEDILELSEKLDAKMYQKEELREALKMQIFYNKKNIIKDTSEDNEDQPSHNAQLIYSYLMLLYRYMIAD